MLKIFMILCLLVSFPADGKAADADAMLFDLAGALRNKDLPRLRELIDARSMVPYAWYCHSAGSTSIYTK